VAPFSDQEWRGTPVPQAATSSVRLGHHIRTIAAKNQPEFLKEPARIADSGV